MRAEEPTSGHGHSPSRHTVTAPTPDRPAAAPPEAPRRPRSRRELRAATSETDVVPDVVPPAMTGAIRRVSADGTLGQVEQASPEFATIFHDLKEQTFATTTWLGVPH